MIEMINFDEPEKEQKQKRRYNWQPKFPTSRLSMFLRNGTY